MEMPENLYQWAWFTFFTVGALGGWGFFIIFGTAVWVEMKKRKHLGLRASFKRVLVDD